MRAVSPTSTHATFRNRVIVQVHPSFLVVLKADAFSIFATQPFGKVALFVLGATVSKLLFVTVGLNRVDFEGSQHHAQEETSQPFLGAHFAKLMVWK